MTHVRNVKKIMMAHSALSKVDWYRPIRRQTWSGLCNTNGPTWLHCDPTRRDESRNRTLAFHFNFGKCKYKDFYLTHHLECVATLL